MTSERSCPACGDPSVSEHLTVRENMFGTGDPFPYAVCGACGTIRLLDIPPDLGAYYPDDYYSVDLDPEQILGRPGVRQFTAAMSRSVVRGQGRAAHLAKSLISRRQFHTLTSLLDSVALAGLPHGAASPILDVGCGSGMLVYALSLGGLSAVTGVDPFAPGDRVLDTGARLRRQDLSDIGSTYDLVMFHHSFEHVPDPQASLKAATSVLADGGRILVRMPTVSSAAFEQYREDWVQLDAPRHLAVFSRAGMQTLCHDNGLSIVATRDDSTSFQFWGSEQVRLGIPLNAPTSHMTDTKASPFSSAQVAAWDKSAAALNAAGRGDQSVWVLERA